MKKFFAIILVLTLIFTMAPMMSTRAFAATADTTVVAEDQPSMTEDQPAVSEDQPVVKDDQSDVTGGVSSFAEETGKDANAQEVAVSDENQTQEDTKGETTDKNEGKDTDTSSGTKGPDAANEVEGAVSITKDGTTTGFATL